MTNRNYKQDNSFGLNEENLILPILEKYFKETISKSTNKYEKWDGASNTTLYEIKSRTNRYNAFNDTIIGANKVLETDKTQIFIFNFTDGIYYIKYEKSLFDTFPNSPFLRNEREDIVDTVKHHYYIPIKKLTLIERKGSPAMTVNDFFNPLKGKCLIKL
jgi:hypothetical protein